MPAMLGPSDRIITSCVGVFITIFLFLLGVLSNLLSIDYFARRMKSPIFSRILCCVSLTDLLTAALTLFVGISYCLGRSEGLFRYHTFTEVWGSLWNFSSRYSVYLVAVVSVTRTVRVVFPFAPLKMWGLYAALIWYAVFLLATTPGLHNVPHYYKKQWCAAALDKSQFVKHRDVKYYLIVLSIPAFLVLTVPVTILSTALSICKICIIRRRKLLAISPQNNTAVTRRDCEIQSAITIFIFTSIYLVLNIPYCITYIYVQVQSARLHLPPPRVIPDIAVKSYVMGVTHVLSISLNALLNPALYYWRIGGFRSSVDERVRSVRAWCGRGEVEHNVVVVNVCPRNETKGTIHSDL